MPFPPEFNEVFDARYEAYVLLAGKAVANDNGEEDTEELSLSDELPEFTLLSFY